MRLSDINCVVVKDLFRFGRNYLEAEKYIDKISPFLGVRFIAVADGYNTIFNLKEAAKTVNFQMENSVADYGKLQKRAEPAGKGFDSFSARIKQLEGCMTEKA